jgi:hypothetical protein
MPKKIRDLNIKDFIDITELIDNNKVSKSQNREFGIKYHNIVKSTKLISLWIDENRFRLSLPIKSQIMLDNFKIVSIILLTILFIIGFFTGLGLLSYSGKEPVNIIYLLFFVVFIPIISISVSIFALFRIKYQDNILLDMLPTFWLQKIIEWYQNSINIKINSSFTNLIFLQKAQYLSLSFSIGLGLALILMVTTTDIAFAWSTTLNITTKEFYDIMLILSYPWNSFISSISLELISESHYFRLGGTVNKEMILNASILGEWWKFLLLSTLFYSIFLRTIIIIIINRVFSVRVTKEILLIDGIDDILKEIQSPIITTASQHNEMEFIQSDKKVNTNKKKSNYNFILGWAMSTKEIGYFNKKLSISSQNIFEVAGNNSLEDDAKVISLVDDNILLYLKSWEPPTMDLVDFLDDLILHIDGVVDIYLVGLESNNLKFLPNELDIYSRWLASLKNRDFINLKV